jgi:hypothetical protein
MLTSEEMMEMLRIDGIKENSMASLRVSLEASLNYIEKDYPCAFNFFFFIGLLPGGIEESYLP